MESSREIKSFKCRVKAQGNMSQDFSERNSLFKDNKVAVIIPKSLFVMKPHAKCERIKISKKQIHNYWISYQFPPQTW